ncbi:Protein phosphatase 1 regulatory subunit 12B [Chelonia mydas]|uniref:Protein phosphatase 1 regulatory subunit 12B n=1 Tax=Chelonia mydas TaxID=8469 RepID=M7C8R9_CHEMY|nr:Protein phosphatase 1 regulatory subunit 12B [Chelonia mydas]
MSSLYTRSKEFTRNRKSQSDSPPSSPSPIAKTLRSWILFVFRLESAGTSPTSSDSYSDRAASRSGAYTRRENRLASLSSRTEEDTNRDYKKLYEGALSENQKLKSKLQEAQLELADIKSKLEKAAQGKRALERRLSEMEEEMKVLTELKSDNQRLKDENGALIRVISKLSK